MPTYNEPDRFPLPLTLGNLAEHMRADALTYMATRGPDDVVGQWLWNLAERIDPTWRQP